MKEYGFDAEAVGLQVIKMRTNGHSNCWCPFNSHERPSGDFDPFKGTFYCYNCKEVSNVYKLAHSLGGIIKRVLIVPPEPSEKQNNWKSLNNLPLGLSDEYLDKRKIFPETIIEFDIKSNADGVYIPVYEDTKLVGIQHRKSYHSSNKYIYHGKTCPLYPLDRLKKLNPNDLIILVEGIFGALKGFQNNKNVFSTFGSNPHPRIKEVLSGHKNILIAFDDDYAGYCGASKLLKLVPQARILIPGQEMDEISSAQWNNIENQETTKSFIEVMKFVSENKKEDFKRTLLKE